MKILFHLPLTSCLLLVLQAFGPTRMDAAATPEQVAESQKLVAEETDLLARLEALRKRKKELDTAITAGKPTVPNGEAASPSQPSEVPPLGEDDFGAWFANFREEYQLKVRQSVFDKGGLEEPALFQYTMPASGSDSWQADVGISLAHDIGIDLPGRPSWRVLGDYHYNEAKGSLKDTVVAAAGLDFLFGGDTGTAQAVSLEGGYKRDNLVSGEGITGSLVWYPTVEVHGIGDFWKPFGPVTARLKPYLGVEGESGNGGIKRFPSGERWSGKAGLSLIGLVLPEHLGNRLETSLNFGWWYHFATSGGYDAYEDSQEYFSATITYWLDRGKEDGQTLAPEEKHFGLSAKYSYGDNPAKGEFDADVWTFGLSIRF